MNKYTPGPWSVDQNMNVMSQGRLVAFPGIAAGFPQKANAQLIAAAPELLKALIRLSNAALARDASSGDPIRVMETRAELFEAMKAAEPAIAKATGGAA